jgi:hypothetical protein
LKQGALKGNEVEFLKKYFRYGSFEKIILYTAGGDRKNRRGADLEAVSQGVCKNKI